MMLSPLKTLNAIGAFRSTSCHCNICRCITIIQLTLTVILTLCRDSPHTSFSVQVVRVHFSFSHLVNWEFCTQIHHSDQNGRQWSKQLLISLRFEELPSNHCELPVQNDEHLFCHRKFRSKFIYISMKKKLTGKSTLPLPSGKQEINTKQKLKLYKIIK